MKLSKAQLINAVATYVAGAKISVDSFSATYNNTVGLLDTVSKIFTLQSNYVDKLAMFDGEFLSYGKTVEEWKSDLKLAEDYDDTGANALSPHRGTYRPVSFSFTLGRKKIPQTIDYDDVERCVHNAEQFAEIIADKYKVITDSEITYRYAMKRQALGLLVGRCVYAMTASNATLWTANADHTNISGLYKDSNNVVYTLVRKYTANAEADVAGAIASGYLIKNELAEEIAQPVDTSTGEAFIEQLKKDVEISEDISEGHSLNANTLGVSPAGLVLIVKQGIMPVLETQVLAGAFHTDKVAVPVEIVRVPDFGNDATGCYAILMDKRGMRLFNSYRAVRENLNGDGDFLNVFAHFEFTAHISKNTFVKAYLPVGE